MVFRSTDVSSILPLARTECPVPKAVNNRLPVSLPTVAKQSYNCWLPIPITDSTVCVRTAGWRSSDF